LVDFSDFPKQWRISHSAPDTVISGQADAYENLYIQTASAVPLLRLIGADGKDKGRLIGWVISGETFHRKNGDIHLPPDTSAEDLFATLAGRFAMLWKAADGRLLFREDSSGNFPASYCPADRAIASSVTLLDAVSPLPQAGDVNAIFEFPKRRGFLPFGLTSRQGARRLMPNHALDLIDFSAHRIWPTAEFCRRPDMSQAEARAHAEEAGRIVKRHMRAILAQGETVLYLSGGHDSRMVLAAGRDNARNLRCETFGEPNSLDMYVSSRVTKLAGIAHRNVTFLPSSRDQVAAWLHRTGYSMYDPVAELVATTIANAPVNNPISGTGSELPRATNWTLEDTHVAKIDIGMLLKRIRVPDHPAVRAAGQAWLDGIPATADAVMILDLAKIEQIHGCWAGAAIYGHPVDLPSLYPFSGQRLSEISLSLPTTYRREGRFYRDYMESLWPELLSIPVNRAIGLDKLRFLRREITRRIPSSVKRWLKPFR
jgi:hypothetical protein